MTLVFKQKWRVALAVVALGVFGLSGEAFAQNTASNTLITNTATVNYTVNSITQTPISAIAEFRVDTVIDVNVTGNATDETVNPGESNVYQSFVVTNASNATSDFALTVVNLAGDGFDINLPGSGTAGLQLRIDANSSGSPLDDPAITSLTGVPRNGSVTVYVVGDVPLSATNGQLANVQLEATAIDPSDSDEWESTPGVDTAMGVEVVVADLAADDTATFVVASAALTVSKTSDVISDPFTTNPVDAKAIPGAVVEYRITVANAAGGQTATLTSISDPIVANTTFVANAFGANNVGVQVGASPEVFCLAEVGADSNGDGCSLVAGAVTVASPIVTTVAASSQVVVRFRVTIQ